MTVTNTLSKKTLLTLEELELNDSFNNSIKDIQQKYQIFIKESRKYIEDTQGKFSEYSLFLKYKNKDKTAEEFESMVGVLIDEAGLFPVTTWSKRVLLTLIMEDDFYKGLRKRTYTETAGFVNCEVEYVFNDNTNTVEPVIRVLPTTSLADIKASWPAITKEIRKAYGTKHYYPKNMEKHRAIKSLVSKGMNDYDIEEELNPKEHPKRNAGRNAIRKHRSRNKINLI